MREIRFHNPSIAVIEPVSDNSNTTVEFQKNIQKSIEQMDMQAQKHLFSGNKGKIKVKRFLGLSLGGGKTDKTSLACLEYYPQYNKIFLNQLYSKIKSTEDVSADQLVYELIESMQRVEYIAVDSPLKLPKCMRCRLKCPGYEACQQPEIKWMWKHYKERNEKKRPSKLFTPYTERCAESYISQKLEVEFHPPHALGSNMAPIMSRGMFLQRRIKTEMIEVFPKLSIWRIGNSIKLSKSNLKLHKHSLEGERVREMILEGLVGKDIAFIYEQDARTMIELSHSFDAFICALTAVLKYKNLTEPRPRSFPKSENWIEFPKENLIW